MSTGTTIDTTPDEAMDDTTSDEATNEVTPDEAKPKPKPYATSVRVRTDKRNLACITVTLSGPFVFREKSDPQNPLVIGVDKVTEKCNRVGHHQPVASPILQENILELCYATQIDTLLDEDVKPKYGQSPADIEFESQAAKLLYTNSNLQASLNEIFSNIFAKFEIDLDGTVTLKAEETTAVA